jgi:hypothetical protein
MSNTITPPQTKSDKILSKLEKNISSTMVKPAPMVVYTKPTEATLISDAEEDYIFTRNRIKNLLKVSDEALESLMTVAAESEHPRSYEVLAAMLKTSAEVTEQLIRLQKQRKELLETQDSNRSTSQAQNGPSVGVFIGTTADLQKQLKSAATVVVSPPPENI